MIRAIKVQLKICIMLRLWEERIDYDYNFFSRLNKGFVGLSCR